MTVHNYRLPLSIEQGATSARRRRSTVISNKAGFESRNRDWVQRRGRWNLATGLQNANDILIVRDLHDLVGGRAEGWLFVDVSDDLIGDPDNPTAAGGNQAIGIGDDVTTQFLFTKLVDISGSGIPTYSHRIFKPLTGRVVILLDNVVQVTGFTVDFVNGIVTFDTAPSAYQVVGLAAEHAYPVRFDTDELEIDLHQFTPDATDIDIAGLNDIPIVEIRLREPTP